MAKEQSHIIKIVRDEIPEIIPVPLVGRYELLAQRGRPVHHHIDKWLRHKLMEEVSEYLEDRNMEELGDIIEAVFACAVHIHGISPTDLLDIVEKKRDKRGGYKDLIILTLLEEKDV